MPQTISLEARYGKIAVVVTEQGLADLRGLSPKQFDGNGNYTFGLQEQSVFHEINQDKIDRVRGFDITVVTTAKTDAEGRSLLRQIGFPFQAEDGQ